MSDRHVMRLPRDTDGSSSNEEAEGYYAAVERHFVGLRGSPLFVSPREWQLIHRWREERIPLRVVKQGLDQCFSRSTPRRPVRRLSYCRPTVEATYRRFREAVAGLPQEKPGGVGEANEVGDYLGQLEEELARARERVDSSRAPLREAIERTAREHAPHTAGATDATRLDELKRKIDALEAALIEAAESALGPGERQRCLDGAARSLGDYRGRMPPQVFESALRSAYLKRVRALFDLPALSLFNL